MKELDLQSRIIKEIRAAGGYGSKWASKMQNGKPDLILALRPYGIFVAECKLENRASLEGIRHAPIPVKTTQIQRGELRAIESGGGIALVFVYVQTPTVGQLYALPSDAKEIRCEGDYCKTGTKTTKIDLKVPELLAEYFGKYARRQG